MSPKNLLKQYENALASQNWNAVEPLMHKDICVTFSNGTYKGIDEVRSVFERNFSSIKEEQYSISNIHWVHSTDTHAICLYDFHWEGMINGEHCSGGGRGTSVLIYSDKKWKIITEHLGSFAS